MLSCQALGAAQTRPTQVRPSVDGRRRRCPRRDIGVPSTRLVGIHFILPRAGSCLAGLALALQRRHRLRRAASNAGRRGGCRACIDEAFGRTTHEWCSACAVGLDPCSSSDVLTGTQSQSRGGRNFRPVRSRFPVLHTHCPRHCRVQTVAFRPSHTVRRGEPKSRPRVPRPPRPVVRGRGPRAGTRILGLGRRSGHGALTPICPTNTLLANDGRARLGPGCAPSGRGRAHATHGVAEECYLVDPASSHMLVSKIKPCMCKYEQIQTVKLRMAH